MDRGRKLLNVVLALAMLAALALGTALPVSAADDRVESKWAYAIPNIDGIFSAGEWDDATVVDLLTVPGNPMAGYWYVKNNGQYLYMLFDMTEDC
jgi:hypothetical protein